MWHQFNNNSPSFFFRSPISLSYGVSQESLVCAVSAFDFSLLRARYEVVGTEEGSYTLQVMSITELETITFRAINITTSTKAKHKYIIDWTSLSQGEKGVTVQTDSDGDGNFELTFTSDSTLVQDEFMSQATSAEAFPWWILGAAAAMVIGIAVAATVLWRRRK